MREQYLLLRALRSNLIVYLITLSLVLCITPLTQAADYTFTTIDPPGSSGSIARGINDAGQIVGGGYTRMARGGMGFCVTRMGAT